MRKGLKYRFGWILAVLLLANAVPGAALPPLPRDARVQEDTLRSGLLCYLVTNPVVAGYADISVASRADSPLLRYADVPVYRTEVLDSILVRAFTSLSVSAQPHAIIVCGDIDPVEIRKKLQLLSVLTPRRDTGEVEAGGEWTSVPEPVIHLFPAAPGALSRVEVSYQAAPVPLAQRNTAQALVTDIFSRQLQVIVRHRLEKEFAREGIPVTALALSSEGQGGPGEAFKVSLSTPESKLDQATAVVARVLSGLETGGVSRAELEDARASMMPAMRREVSAPLSNGQWTERCVRHYRYGTHLAPFSEEFRLFGKKALEGDVYVGLLNNYSSALFSYADNLTLQLHTSRDTLDHGTALVDYICQYLDARLQGPPQEDYSWHGGDTLALDATAPKIQLKNERMESLSGGKLWTFSNGMRVIFKRVKGSGAFHYALLLNGGLSQITTLKEGEGGYIGPLLSLYGAAGMDAPAFRDLLAANGIALDAHVELNTLSLAGSAPSPRLALLLKTLLALSTDRTPDAAAFKTYREQELLGTGDPAAPLFALLNPGYAYGPWRKPSALTEKTRQKADKYYQERFSHMGDAILILSGDLPEEGTKRLLLRYLGAFPTAKGNVPRRNVAMRTLSGVSTRTDGDHAGAFHVLLDTDYAVTTAHFYSAHLAADALRTSLRHHLSAYGYTAGVEVLFCAQPQERFQLLVTCTPVAAGTSAERALSAVRAAIREAAAAAPEEVDLTAWKKKLTVQMQGLLSSPEGQVAALQTRYALNKDFTSRYAEAIAAILPEEVHDFLLKLSAGGRVEYLLR